MKAPFVAMAGVWLAAMLVVAMLVTEARFSAIKDAKETADILAYLVSEHTAQTFKSAGAALEQLAREYEAQPHLPDHDPGFRARLEDWLTSLPAAEALFVVGRDGFIRHATDDREAPRQLLAGHGFFEAGQTDPAARFDISEPLLSHQPGLGWFVAATGPLRRGAFDGIVVAALRPDYFEAFFHQISRKSGDVVRLHHRNGTLLAHRSAGSATAAPARVRSERAVPDLPLVVSVSQHMDDVLRAWRRSAWTIGVAMAVLSVLLFLQLARLERERRLREAERRRRAQAEKIEALGQLTGGLAHDFGNFLQIIGMNVTLLRDPATSPRQRDRALGAAEHAVKRSAVLVRRLLGFARRESLTLGQHDLHALIADMQGLLEQAAGERIEVAYELAQALPPVLGDPTQIQSALLNLVVNARDAIAGTGRIVVRTYWCGAPAPGRVCLEVEDNGPGMSAKVRRRALEPYFSTKGDGGTGLGLPQVYGFMRQIGGDLRLDAAPGGGAIVTMIFPQGGGR